MKKLIVIILITILISIFIFFKSNNKLTSEDLLVLNNRLTLLNNNDFTGLKNAASYRKDIGTYNGMIVQEAFQCWGDVCPKNGRYFLTYKGITKENCESVGGNVVEGYSGWASYTYGGCSPV